MSLIVANFNLPNNLKQMASYEARGFFHKLVFPAAKYLRPSNFVIKSPAKPRAIKRQRRSSAPIPSSSSQDNEDNVQVQTARRSLNY